MTPVLYLVRLTAAPRAYSAAEVKSAGWTRSAADVREWLDAEAAMVGGGAAETALTEALAEAAGMFVLPPRTGVRPAAHVHDPRRGGSLLRALVLS